MDASLLYQLGEQLVARRSIALAELIKNSYDADARTVTVLLENVMSPGGTIIVQDDGSGMTFEDIRDNWMRVGTRDKVEQPLSPIYGRPRTGAKGVGRFAVRKLGEKLTLHSVAERNDGTREEVTVEFDWRENFEAGRTLNQIPVSYQRKSVDKDTPTGVILYIESTQDAWTKDDISDLRADLLSLINPFTTDGKRGDGRPKTSKGKYKPDPGFNFKLEVPEFPGYEGDLRDEFFKAAWGHLMGKVDKKGFAHYHLDIRAQKEILDFSPTDERFTQLPDAQFEIHFFIYRSDLFQDVDFGVRDATRMGREHGGVRIYLDGFRVFPYGDPGDDWLSLNDIRARRTPQLLHPTAELSEMERRVPGRPALLTPGNNQLFGAIEISRFKQPAIEINISRERLVENDAFEELRRFVLVGLYWMTIQYARLLYKEREREARKQLRQQSASALINEVQVQARSLGDRSTGDEGEILKEIVNKLGRAKEVAKAEEQERIDELSLLRVLASAGTTVSVMDHQFRNVVDGARAVYTDMKELRPSIEPAGRKNFESILKQMQEWREAMEGQFSLLEVLLSADARYRREPQPLRDLVERVEKAFSLYMLDYAITFHNEVPANLKTPPLFVAELGAVLFNVMSNSLKAVLKSDRREIAIQAARAGGELTIKVLDTGIGIDPTKREVVFDAFETTSTPDPILGAGTGLGLKVVRDILESYNGSARFVNTKRPWVTCLEITLPE